MNRGKKYNLLGQQKLEHMLLYNQKLVSMSGKEVVSKNFEMIILNRKQPSQPVRMKIMIVISKYNSVTSKK